MDEKKTMDTYIRESAEALKNMLFHMPDEVEKLKDLYVGQPCQKIRIVASGSSYNGALCARFYMQDILKTEIEVTTPFEFVHYIQIDKAFTFVISQSGRSTNAIEALDILQRRGEKAIGITGNPQSIYREHCDYILDYGVGEETVGYVTKGVVTLILFLDLFALQTALGQGKIKEEIYQEEIRKLKEAVERYGQVYDQSRDFITRNFSLLTSMHQAYVLGSHTAYGIAAEAALKIGETVCIPASSFESEEFLHGPNLQLTPTYSVFIIDAHDETSQRSLQIYQAVSAVCERCFYIGLGKEDGDTKKLMIPMNTEHNLLPFVYLQFFQLVAYQVTESLHRWEKHPMFARFRDRIEYKIK